MLNMKKFYFHDFHYSNNPKHSQIYKNRYLFFKIYKKVIKAKYDYSKLKKET